MSEQPRPLIGLNTGGLSTILLVWAFALIFGLSFGWNPACILLGLWTVLVLFGR
jgi:hypothetical protein